MSSSLRRGALAAAAIAFSIASLAACGAGNNAQTLQIQPDNAATSVGDVKIQNAIVITQPDAEATGPSAVSATLFNNGSTDQTVDSITVAGESAVLKPAEGSGNVTVPAGGSVILGGEGNASAVLSTTPEDVKDGNAQPVTFTFSRTGEVKLRAFVVPAEHYFKEWGPAEVPQAPGSTASGTPSEPASGSPSASTSTSPGSTPSGAASASTGATPSDSASQSAAGQ
ncbi:DUF461 domain-containing protein [Streptomyces cavernae]|uniref:DUF461 domain-containing protein n=1 Tax=Streptomyces cavernae TaxID=2259034 RepID=UPI000FEBE314|nr:DUF461 domain-containing protein [Streptomyces cavernae]